MLRAMADLHRAGLPVKVLTALARIYAEGVEAIQLQVVDMFTDGRGLDWAPGEFDEFRTIASGQGDTMLVSMRRLVDYTHHRTIQRLALGAIERGAIPPLDS
jgi:hypothetical protein